MRQELPGPPPRLLLLHRRDNHVQRVGQGRSNAIRHYRNVPSVKGPAQTVSMLPLSVEADREMERPRRNL